MVEPRKLAFRYTTKDPSHIITKIDVIIAFDYDSVRKERVAESRRHSTSGPHRSPEYEMIYSCAAPSWLFP